MCLYVVQALKHAWQRAQLVHRDIKPDNIFLSKTGEVKLGDLGLAKTLDADNAELTQTNMAMGTAYYVAPEQVQGARDVDFHADIYSLGCTLYHLLTGHFPYDGATAVSVMMKQVSNPPPDISKVWPACPPPLAALLGKMRRKNAAERHSSYDELIADLYAASEPTPASAPDADTILTVQPVVPQKSPAARYAVMAVAVLAVLGFAAGLLHWKSRTSGPVRKASTELTPGKAQRTLAAHPLAAGERWTNSLGQVFAPVPGTDVQFCLWHTRVQDFEAFVKATGHDATQGMVSLKADGWKARGDSWKSPGFAPRIPSAA